MKDFLHLIRHVTNVSGKKLNRNFVFFVDCLLLTKAIIQLLCVAQNIFLINKVFSVPLEDESSQSTQDDASR